MHTNLHNEIPEDFPATSTTRSASLPLLSSSSLSLSPSTSPSSPSGSSGPEYLIPPLIGSMQSSSFMIFTYLGEFLSYITPHDLPIVNCVLELLKNVFHTRVSIYELIFQALKIESGFICLIAIFILISIIPIGFVIAWIYSPNKIKLSNSGDSIHSNGSGSSSVESGDGGGGGRRRGCAGIRGGGGGGNSSNPHNNTNNNNHGRDTPPVNPLISLDEPVSNAVHCRRRFLQFVLHIIILMLIASITGMIITNEQIRTAVSKTPQVIRASLKDVEIYLNDVEKQINSIVHDGLNSATERIRYDIEDIDKLLGEPIYQELEQHTGIELSFEIINGICSANFEIIHRIQVLHKLIIDSITESQEATSRIEELQVQLAVMQRQCVGRDKPLCDTLKMKGFLENRYMETLMKLQNDPSLYKMLTLGEFDINGITRNLTTELDTAKIIFRGITNNIKENGTNQLSSILKQLTPMKNAAAESTKHFSQLIHSLIDTIDKTWRNVTPVLDTIEETGHFLWKISLLITIMTLTVTLILMVALSYGYCQAEHRAGCTFILGAVLISLSTIVLVIFTTFSMLLGGHAEVFICRSLYDSPNYVVLGKLLDRPGLLFRNGTGSGGIIGDILQQQRSSALSSSSPPMYLINQTADVEEIFVINNSSSSSSNIFCENGKGNIDSYRSMLSLKIALEKCPQEATTFEIFQLESIMNISCLLDIKNYPDLIYAIDQISITSNNFNSLTDSLQHIFEDMYLNTEIDLAAYRGELNHPAPEKDLGTFIDQMQRVSLHIQDVATSSRMAMLGNRARRLQLGLLQQIHEHRNNIIFHLTALELEKEPWANQVNQSLLHLKTTQFFLNKDGEKIFKSKTKSFKERLKNHLIDNKNRIITLLKYRVASCRPLYEIFDANRLLFCHHMMDPLNGLWFSGLMCLIFWAFATPIALALATIYRQMNSAQRLRHTNSHQAPSDSLIISEQSNWAASSSQRTSGIDRSNWQGSLRSVKWETASFILNADNNYDDDDSGDDFVSTQINRQLDRGPI